MAKPSSNSSASFVKSEEYTKDIPEVQVDSESNVPYTNIKASTETVIIRSLIEARLIYTGQVTGKQYTWNTAGSIVPVDTLDSETLLAKRVGGRNLCCGNSKDGNKMFEIAI